MIVLNLGAGNRAVPEGLADHDAQIISVDIDGSADVKADVRALPFANDYADVAYASHLLEHFDEHELPALLAEWRRVLKPGGKLLIEVPDVQSAAQMIAVNGVDAVLYRAVNGAMIRGLDVLFGWQEFIATGGDPMRHKTAFDKTKLAGVLGAAGFNGQIVRRPEIYTLIAHVTK